MFLLGAATFVISLLMLLGWQHLRYRRARRRSAQDLQHALHPRRAFHVLVFFRVPEGERVIDTARAFLAGITGRGQMRLVYAGQAVFTLPSEQLPQLEWHGVFLLQYPDRAHFDAPDVQSHLAEKRSLFADSYIHGMHRNRRVSLAMPQYLLGVRIRDILRGRWRVPPLKKLPAFDTSPEYDDWRRRISRLEAIHTVNPRGLVTYYLVRKWQSEELFSDQEDSGELMSRMAALRHGPLHIGNARALEQNARFEYVFALHYPSAAYFSALMSSGFYQRVVSYPQHVDTLGVATVPITAQLE